MLIASKRVLLFDEGGYLARMKTLFGSSMIGYWPMGEPSGAVALDYSGLDYHGAYTGVALGQPGIGDGRTCPLFDGAASFMQPPAGFRTAFNGNEGSILAWYQVFNSGVWTDGVTRVLYRIQADGSNSINAFRNGANRIDFQRIAGGTTKTSAVTGLSYTNAFHIGYTWSDSGEAAIVYINGSRFGATQTPLETWVGVPAAASTVIGATSSVPALVWNGYLAHYCVLNRAATGAEVAAAAVI